MQTIDLAVLLKAPTSQTPDQILADFCRGALAAETPRGPLEELKKQQEEEERHQQQKQLLEAEKAEQPTQSGGAAAVNALKKLPLKAPLLGAVKGSIVKATSGAPAGKGAPTGSSLVSSSLPVLKKNAAESKSSGGGLLSTKGAPNTKLLLLKKSLPLHLLKVSKAS